LVYRERGIGLFVRKWPIPAFSGPPVVGSPLRALSHQRARRGGVRLLLSVIPRRGMWLALGLVRGLFGEYEGPRWARSTALAYDLQIFSNS
jgi:hypothetical protein